MYVYMYTHTSDQSDIDSATIKSIYRQTDKFYENINAYMSSSLSLFWKSILK
jgi:hypothetical protein